MSLSLWYDKWKALNVNSLWQKNISNPFSRVPEKRIQRSDRTERTNENEST